MARMAAHVPKLFTRGMPFSACWPHQFCAPASASFAFASPSSCFACACIAAAAPSLPACLYCNACSLRTAACACRFLACAARSCATVWCTPAWPAIPTTAPIYGPCAAAAASGGGGITGANLIASRARMLSVRHASQSIIDFHCNAALCAAASEYLSAVCLICFHSFLILNQVSLELFVSHSNFATSVWTSLFLATSSSTAHSLRLVITKACSARNHACAAHLDTSNESSRICAALISAASPASGPLGAAAAAAGVAAGAGAAAPSPPCAGGGPSSHSVLGSCPFPPYVFSSARCSAVRSMHVLPSSALSCVSGRHSIRQKRL